MGVLAIVGWTLATSAALFIGINRTIGMRVDEETEETGLDTIEHGESAYELPVKDRDIATLMRAALETASAGTASQAGTSDDGHGTAPSASPAPASVVDATEVSKQESGPDGSTSSPDAHAEVVIAMESDARVDATG